MTVSWLCISEHTDPCGSSRGPVLTYISIDNSFIVLAHTQGRPIHCAHKKKGGKAKAICTLLHHSSNPLQFIAAENTCWQCSSANIGQLEMASRHLMGSAQILGMVNIFCCCKILFLIFNIFTGRT